MNPEEAIQAQQVEHCQLAMRDIESKRLRVKLTYIVGGMIIGATAATIARPQKPMQSVIIGAIAGEYLGWLLHGLRYNKWFM